MKAIDEIGNVYGRLKVLRKDIEKSKKTGKSYWICECNCKDINKNIVSVYRDHLLTGHTKSCGCLKEELKSEDSKNQMIQSLRKRWNSLKSRCNNPKSPRYKDYGGRGIIYCKEWEQFENFKNDLYDSFVSHVEQYGLKDTTLDRIDVNGNYEPSNCRWATQKEQMNNKRNNVVYTYKDKTLTLKEWSAILGISYSALVHRLERGWSVERALTTPQRKLGKLKNKIGETKMLDNIVGIVKENHREKFDAVFEDLRREYEWYCVSEDENQKKRHAENVEELSYKLGAIAQVLRLLG